MRKCKCVKELRLKERLLLIGNVQGGGGLGFNSDHWDYKETRRQRDTQLRLWPRSIPLLDCNHSKHIIGCLTFHRPYLKHMF